jgi:hypothetical protein
MSDNMFTYALKIVQTVAILTFLFLGALPFVAEYISGDKILSGSIGPSEDLEASIMLTENEKVTIIFKTDEMFLNSDLLNSELLNISLVDPEKKGFSWRKSFAASDEPGTTKVDFFSFTPEASGIHHIKINNADFQTEIKIVSGMISLTGQALYLPVLITSLIVTLAGAFLLRNNRMISRGFSLSGTLNFLISLSLSLLIVYKIVGL